MRVWYCQIQNTHCGDALWTVPEGPLGSRYLGISFGTVPVFSNSKILDEYYMYVGIRTMECNKQNHIV